MMRAALARGLTAPMGALGLVVVLVLALLAGRAAHGVVSLPPIRELSAPVRASILARLRGAMAPSQPSAPALPSEPLVGRGPIIATLFGRGVALVRVEGEGATLEEAVAQTALRLRAAIQSAQLTAEVVAEGRLEIHVVGARAPYLRWPEFAGAYGIVPGLDGIEATWSGHTVRLTATELNLADVFVAAKPFPFSRFFKTARDGVSSPKLDRLVRERFGLTQWPDDSRRYARFRAETFVEGAQGQPVSVARGLAAVELTQDSLLRAARAGGAYLVRQIAEDGRFRYQVDVSTLDGTSGRLERSGYSLPRHAGAAYFLARLEGITHDETLRPVVDRSLAYVETVVSEGACHGKTAEGHTYACVSDAGELNASLGGTAMPVVAMLEQRRNTGDTHRDELVRALLEWLLLMQAPDGTFADRFSLDAGKPIRDKKKLRYFTGESALALAMGYKAYGDERYLRAVEKGLDAQLAFYDYFVGKFFIETEHWTCLAAAAAWPALKHERYRAFCDAYGKTMRVSQLDGGSEQAQRDLAGGYLFAPFFVPRANPVATSTEAMVAAFQLSVAHGRPDERLRGQVLAAARFLLRQQITPDSDYWVQMPEAEGAFLTSAIDPTVRIDTIQHVGSALLGARELLP